MMTKDETDNPDFRVRVAAEKRDRMRQRLLAATLQACAGPGGPASVVTDDIVKAAGVSRGAFYRHFASLNDAIAALVSSLVAEIVTTAQTMFPDIEDGALGCALGSQLLLFRAAREKDWAGFVAGSGLLLDAPPLRAVLSTAIHAGARRGPFTVPGIDVAVDGVAGTLLAGIRHLHRFPEDSDAYIRDLSIILLQSLGMPGKAAIQTTDAALLRIDGLDPEQVPWLRTARGAEPL